MPIIFQYKTTQWLTHVYMMVHTILHNSACTIMLAAWLSSLVNWQLWCITMDNIVGSVSSAYIS